MASREEITIAISVVLQEIAKTLGTPLPAADDLPLLGEASSLDSLAALNFFVLLEEEVSRAFGKRISFLDESLLGAPEGRLDTVGNLREYLFNELEAPTVQ